jgi:hypothetical protein
MFVGFLTVGLAWYAEILCYVMPVQFYIIAWFFRVALWWLTFLTSFTIVVDAFFWNAFLVYTTNPALTFFTCTISSEYIFPFKGSKLV